MTRFLVTIPNTESVIPVGLEQGARYVIVSADGRRATFNDPSDVDHVGFLTAPPTGFDSADIRESSDVIVEGDGGVHGNFYLGRRPWTLTGMIDPTARGVDEAAMTLAELVNRRIDKLKRATRSRLADAILYWVPQGGVPVQLSARLLGLRVTERHPKNFLLSMVSADPRIVSSILKDESAAGNAQITARNDGNTPAAWTITLRDNWANPTVTNDSTGQIIDLTMALAATDVCVIDSRSKTITKNGSNAYSALGFPGSEWFDLIPGDNILTPTGRGTTGTSGTWSVEWRDAWE